MALLSPGGIVSGNHMAGHLEVTRRTVQRDIDYLRDQLKLPIETVTTVPTADRGYRLTKPLTICPLCARAHN